MYRRAEVRRRTATMLCLCAPAGQDEFFQQIGDLVDSRAAPPPQLIDAQQPERREKAGQMEAQYHTEMLTPQ